MAIDMAAQMVPRMAARLTVRLTVIINPVVCFRTDERGKWCVPRRKLVRYLPIAG